MPLVELTRPLYCKPYAVPLMGKLALPPQAARLSAAASRAAGRKSVIKVIKVSEKRSDAANLNIVDCGGAHRAHPVGDRAGLVGRLRQYRDAVRGDIAHFRHGEAGGARGDADPVRTVDQDQAGAAQAADRTAQVVGIGNAGDYHGRHAEIAGPALVVGGSADRT